MNELGSLIWELADTLKLIEKKEVECCGVTPYQGFLLMKLLENRESAIQDLARQMNVAVSTMSRNVDKLEEKKLVQRKQASHDARSCQVSLTETGASAARQISSSWEDYFIKLTENISRDERHKVYEGLRILQAAIRRIGNCCE
jgi:DNA-binding MarR family transcriptional regulator